MKQMSFSMTKEQVRNRTKFVTRRNGWRDAKPGDIVMAIEKGQGLKKGEKVVPIGPIKIVSVRLEKLSKFYTDGAYGREECIKEGFQHLTPGQFVEMYCQANACIPSTVVTRLEFEYL